ncbi:hypothetical protein GMA10_04775 [Kocuria koreensis]|uniref:Uncharacterized protein n=1 Tax=Rothia koreensis TaxID=592378 RepID=A0A7K1LHF2_9MICC|nr:hypothetical protein [Rothia koreensis]MUN54530.1 hypothetical protein [Rothia koreensis]
MPAVESRPYAVPEYGSVSSSISLVAPEIELNALAETWEPGLDLEFRMDAHLEDRFWTQSMTSRNEPLFLVGLVYCPSLRTRWTNNATFCEKSGRHSANLSINIPGNRIAAELRYELWVVGNGRTGYPVYGVDPPLHYGAKLWELKGQRTIALDSSQNAFPTSAVSFSRTGRPQVPWVIEVVDDAEPDWNLHGCIRTYVNTDLEIYKKILDDKAPGYLYEQIEADIYSTALHKLAAWSRTSGGADMEALAESDAKSLAALGRAGAEKMGLPLNQALETALEDPMSLTFRLRETFKLFQDG